MHTVYKTLQSVDFISCINVHLSVSPRASYPSSYMQVHSSTLSTLNGTKSIHTADNNIMITFHFYETLTLYCCLL